MKNIKLNYTNSGSIIIGLLIISVFAFWNSYYLIFFESAFYVHFHAFTALLWFAMLVLQPYLIKKRKLDLHRQLGKASIPVAGLVIISIILLAHNRISTAEESFYNIQTYILYLQISLAFAFAVTYGLAMYFRHTTPIHSRLMVATTLTFVDPIFARLIFTYLPEININGQWLTFGIINLILIALSLIDRSNRKVRWVFPGLLVLYIIIEIPIYFGLTDSSWWQNFAAWLASI